MILTKKIIHYNKVTLYFGIKSNGTLQSMEIRAFPGETFTKGYIYNGYLGDELISLKIDENDATKIIISRSNTNTTINFRTILGTFEDIK